MVVIYNILQTKAWTL